MFFNREVFGYSLQEQLNFEHNLRKSIVEVALNLSKSRLVFETFRDSWCNEVYWKRTAEGGFLLKNGVRPSMAIKDIFINGPKYGTECATAIVIIYYGALLNIFPEELFNRVFSKIYLMDWQNLDANLGITTIRDVVNYLPGDCRYFKNPDVDQNTPEWQGENVIDLGNGTYYGHGLGIRTAEGFIEALNRHRKEGAQISAFLTYSANRLNFKHLGNIYYNFAASSQVQNHRTAWGIL